MNARRFVTPAAALVIAAALTGVTAPAASATIVGRSTGFGATQSAAEFNARSQLFADYFGCRPPFLIVGSGQNADATWWAVASANCTGFR